MKTETKIGLCTAAFLVGVAGIVSSKLALFDVPLGQNVTRALAGEMSAAAAAPATSTATTPTMTPLPAQKAAPTHNLPAYVPAAVTR